MSEQHVNRHRPPRILLALPLPPPRSGQERLTESLLRCGLDATFELLHVNTSLGGSNAARGRFTLRRLWRAARISGQLALTLIVKQPDILNVPLAKNRWGFLRSACLILTGVLCGARVVSRLGGDHFDRFYNASGALMRPFIRFVLDRIDAVIVRGHGLKRQFEGLVDPSRLHCVYLGLCAQDFERPASWAPTNDGTFRVLFVGHISKAKGAFDLIRAVPKAVARIPHARFVFAGEQLAMERDVVHVAPGRDLNLEREAALQIDETRRYVTFVSAEHLSDLQSLYWNADVFVLPSHSEGFPFAVLEAMAAGLPLVVTPAGALAEVLTPAVNARLVPYGDAEALADAIVALALDDGLREQVARNNRQLVREKFGLEQLRARMECVYRGVLEPPGALPARPFLAAREKRSMDQRS